jgi:hypothetical protein
LKQLVAVPGFEPWTRFTFQLILAMVKRATTSGLNKYWAGRENRFGLKSTSHLLPLGFSHIL